MIKACSKNKVFCGSDTMCTEGEGCGDVDLCDLLGVWGGACGLMFLLLTSVSVTINLSGSRLGIPTHGVGHVKLGTCGHSLIPILDETQVNLYFGMHMQSHFNIHETMYSL